MCYIQPFGLDFLVEVFSVIKLGFHELSAIRQKLLITAGIFIKVLPISIAPRQVPR